ncbi:MAG: MoxR family ATPase [Proteobacteria bacterium]|nr:MoxR family ATPase [Pseudomonadota bacterium]
MDSSVKKVLDELNRTLLGKTREVELAFATLLAGGSLLIEDRPGFGKTTLAKGLSRVLGLSFNRIQCTNDLLPLDILGRIEFDSAGAPVFMKGPVFSSIVLLDELNRAPARTQSAFLQAMEENEVTLEGITAALPSPQMFIATQNPSDQVGTTLLPESELDRFTARISIGVPDPATEKRILMEVSGKDRSATVLTDRECIALQERVRAVHASEAFLELIIRFLNHARSRGALLSPRAGKDLLRMSRAIALIRGRDFVTPADLKEVMLPVISHRTGNADEIAGSFSFLA